MLQAQKRHYERARASNAATGNWGGVPGSAAAAGAGAAMAGARPAPPPPIVRPGAAVVATYCTEDKAAALCATKPAVDRFYAEPLSGCT